MASSLHINVSPSTLLPFQNAGGHEGVRSDPNNVVIVKPCTQSEVDFYEDTLITHPSFAQLMPKFMGTISLGAPSVAHQKDPVTAIDDAEASQLPKPQINTLGRPITTDLAIVLDNLEHGFTKPNVIDLKLGAKLCAPGTAPEKAARLDRKATRTTSGSLNFRITGMKEWNSKTNSYDKYNKAYGEAFDKDTVKEGFSTFFASLFEPAVRPKHAEQLLRAILAEVTKARRILEQLESRFYSSSLLIVFEGDSGSLNALMDRELRTPNAIELSSKSSDEGDGEDEDEDEEDDEDDELEAFKVKVIDFAHSSWCPGQGQDENVISGLKNIESQFDMLLAKLG